MPGTGKYGTTYDRIDKTSERADLNLLAKLFSPSPNSFVNMTHAQLIEIAKQYLTPKVALGDPMLFPGGVDMTYSGAPSFDEVQAEVDKHKGAEGWPTTPYTPALASPGPENKVDFNKIPETIITVGELQSAFSIGPTGVNGTVDPSKTSAEMAATSELDATQETLKKGAHPGGSTTPVIVP